MNAPYCRNVATIVLSAGVTVQVNSAPTESQPDQPPNRPSSMLLLSGRTTTTVPCGKDCEHAGPLAPRQSIVFVGGSTAVMLPNEFAGLFTVTVSVGLTTPTGPSARRR